MTQVGQLHEPQHEVPGTTEGLVELARGVRFDGLPDEVVRRVGLYVLDWLGVTIRGSTTPAARITRATVSPTRPRGRAAAVLGEAPMWAALPDAALLNGVASHALDYDDGSGTSGLPHSGVTIMPTLLALAQEAHSTGESVVAAVVAGQELGVRVASIVEPEHYARGFHNLATTGMFSSAGAGAHLLNLDPGQWRNALGIAGSLASGLRASFGTMTKPLHAGRAASGAVLACLLARQGFTANPDIIEAPNGYAHTMTQAPRFDRGKRPLARPYVIEGVRFKLHASCTGTQSAIDALIAVRDAEHLRPADIESVQIAVSPIMLEICGIRWPSTGLEGKFSLPFTAALALHGRNTTEDGFTDHAVQDPLLHETMARVALVPLAHPRSNDDTEVVVLTREGHKLHRRHRFAENRLALRAEAEAVTEKFVRLVSGLLPATRIDKVVESTLTLHNLESVDQLTKALTRR